MQDYIVFQLTGPLAAWGDIAIGENRPTHHSPTRSAVIGLLAGALRIRRDDTQALAALHETIGVGTLTLTAGSVTRDYHTSQVPPAVALKGLRVVTRRDELLELRRYNRKTGSSTGTMLSTREYLCDGAWLVAVWVRNDGRSTLESILQALDRPGFVPYLGRKSCPVMLPLGARAISANSIHAALHQWWSERPTPSVAEVMPRSAAGMYRLEWDIDGLAGVPEISRALRRDDPADRKRWQFKNRSVCQGECALEESP